MENFLLKFVNRIQFLFKIGQIIGTLDKDIADFLLFTVSVGEAFCLREK